MNKKSIIPFIDLLFCLLLIFICIIMLLKVTKVEEKPSFQPNIIYQIVLNWEGNTDLDSHLLDPKKNHISFQRREGGQGSLASLNRDCLGQKRTELDEYDQPVTEINEEIVSLRGCFDGEYIFNIHDYHHEDDDPVEATITLMKFKPYTKLKERKLILSHNGEEKTAFRFTIKNEEIIDISELPASIIYH